MTTHTPLLNDLIAQIRAADTEHVTKALFALRDELENRADADWILSCWSTADVAGRRPDLTRAECLAVLRTIERYHDAEIGIQWDVIDMVADDLYPEPDNLDALREAAQE